MENENRLTRTWRPILMLLFGFIVFNNYIIHPWILALFGIAVMIPIPEAMWSLLQLGIGGFIIGRSIEKGIDAWKNNSGLK